VLNPVGKAIKRDIIHVSRLKKAKLRLQNNEWILSDNEDDDSEYDDFVDVFQPSNTDDVVTEPEDELPTTDAIEREPNSATDCEETKNSSQSIPTKVPSKLLLTQKQR